MDLTQLQTEAEFESKHAFNSFNAFLKEYLGDDFQSDLEYKEGEREEFMKINDMYL